MGEVRLTDEAGTPYDQAALGWTMDDGGPLGCCGGIAPAYLSLATVPDGEPARLEHQRSDGSVVSFEWLFDLRPETEPSSPPDGGYAHGLDPYTNVQLRAWCLDVATRRVGGEWREELWTEGIDPDPLDGAYLEVVWLRGDEEKPVAGYGWQEVYGTSTDPEPCTHCDRGWRVDLLTADPTVCLATRWIGYDGAVGTLSAPECVTLGG